MSEYVTLAVPASTANLGAGFDTLALALDLYNTISLQLADDLQFEINGAGSDSLPRDTNNLVWCAIKALYKRIGQAPPKLHIVLDNRIPLARGLGSSAAAVVGGLFGANILAGSPLLTSDLLNIACHLEGHPDNVAAALHGGLVVAVQYEDRAFCVKCPVPLELRAALFVPDQPMSTYAARKVLPTHIARTDAVFNISRAAAFVAAMTTNQMDYLGEATQDRLHQPYREKLFPAMPRLFSAAREAGALGVFLSGAGSTICALCTDNAYLVAEAMAVTAQHLGVSGQTLVTGIAPTGARAIQSSGLFSGTQLP